jgi:hypothetical protein
MKILLYEMKFLVPNYSCLQNPWLGGYRPQIPVLSVLCPQLNLLNPPPKKKIPGYAPGAVHVLCTVTATIKESVSCVHTTVNNKQPSWSILRSQCMPWALNSPTYCQINLACRGRALLIGWWQTDGPSPSDSQPYQMGTTQKSKC